MLLACIVFTPRRLEPDAIGTNLILVSAIFLSAVELHCMSDTAYLTLVYIGSDEVSFHRVSAPYDLDLPVAERAAEYTLIRFFRVTPDFGFVLSAQFLKLFHLAIYLV